MRNILFILLTAIIVASCGKAHDEDFCIPGTVKYIPVNVSPAENVKFKWNEENELTTIDVPAEGAAFDITGSETHPLFIYGGINVSIYGQNIKTSVSKDSTECKTEWFEIKGKNYGESINVIIRENTSSVPRGVDILYVQPPFCAQIKITQLAKTNDD